MHSNYKNKMVKDDGKDTKVFLGVTVDKEVSDKLDMIKHIVGIPKSKIVNSVLLHNEILMSVPTKVNCGDSKIDIAELLKKNKENNNG